MGKYSKKQAADVQTISTLGGDYALKWDDETQMSVNAHAASRPLLQSCIARLSRHARRGMVTIYTATSGKARETYRAISAFLSKVASASLGPLRPLRRTAPPRTHKGQVTVLSWTENGLHTDGRRASDG